MSGLRGIGKGPEEVENGRHAEIAAGSGRVAQRGMEQRREAERDSRLIDARRHERRSQIDDHAELLEQVGRSAGG